MSSALQFLRSTKHQLRSWSWLKRSLLLIASLTFLASSFLFLTGPGTNIRVWMAQTVIITQHRDWAWIFVGAAQRDEMVRQMHDFIENNAAEKQVFGNITLKAQKKNRSIDDLIKVEDISGPLWKGKRMYVFDPKSIRLMTPSKSGEGEKITSMVQRTGAVAGVNGGGFDDPEGLGNGFAALGAVISGGEIIYTDQDGSIPQHIVGFTKDGTLVIGKYNMFELRDMGISEAASFYPRVIANGKPLTINDASRAPRTAVGQKADGTVIFIVIDGRQAHSVGATLKEVQDLFLADGVINAGFLDGGASSEMVVNGELVTKPSSRYGERRLPSAFLVYDHPEDVKALRVWDGIDKIDAGGSYDHPDFLREQAELKNKQKTTPATTPSKTDTTDKTKSPAAGSSSSSKTSTPAATSGKDTDTDKSSSAPAGNAKETTPAKSATQQPSGASSSAGSSGKSTGGSTETGGSTAPASSATPAGSGSKSGGSSSAPGSGSTSPVSETPAAAKSTAPVSANSVPTVPAAPTAPVAPTSPAASTR